MKQTNSAITFLMAQYRAIFKNANLKMILAATAAVASLSVGAANAADGNLDANEWDQALTDGKGVITITGESKDQGAEGKFQHLNIAATAETNLNLKDNQKIVISDNKSAYSDNVISATGTAGKLNITGNGDLEITAITTSKPSHGLEIKALDSGSVNVHFDNVTVYSNLHIVTSGSDTSSRATLTANKIVIGKTEFVTGEDKIPRGRATLVLGEKEGNFNGKGSSTLGSDSTVLTINKAGKLRAVGTNGGTASGDIKDVGTTIKAAEVNVNGGIVSFATAAADGKTTYKAAKTTVNNGWFSVKSGANTTLDMGKDGVMNFEGTSTIDVGSSLAINSGKVDIGSKTVLAGREGAQNTDAQIKIGDGSSKDVTATLSVGKATLSAFLKADKLKYIDENKQFTDVEHKEATATKGNILVTSGGELFLKDAVDLAKDFTFATTAAAGKIAVTAGGRVGADDVTISETVTDGTNMNVVAKKLTLGSAKFDSSTKGLGVASLHAENVSFVPSGDAAFTLQNNLTLDTFGNGTITGSVTVGTAGNAGQIHIAEGNYTLENGKDLTITSGSGSVGLSIKDASLTVSGKLVTTETNGKIKLADGRLDASRATLDLKKGTVTMSGYSTLELDGSKILTLSDTGNLVDFKKGFAADAVSGDNSSTILLKNMSSMTMDQFKELKTDTGFNGMFSGISISGPAADKSMKLDGTDAGIQSGIGGYYNNTQAQVANTFDIENAYSVGNVALTAGDSVSISGGALTLTNASANGAESHFVQDKDGNVAGVTFKEAGSLLTLQNTGTIGSIVTETAGQGTVLIGGASGRTETGNVTVSGSIGTQANYVAEVDVGANSTLTVKGDVHTKEMYTLQNSHVNMPDNSLTIGKDAQQGSGKSEILGDVTAKTITVAGSGGVMFAGGGTVKVETLAGAGSGTFIQIGNDEEGGLGATVIADKLNLNSGTIFIDPDFNVQSSIQIVKELEGGKLNGKAIIGQNAVLAIGFDNKADVQSVLSDYLDSNGGFKAGSSVQNALVLNKGIEISSGDTIVIDPSATAQSAPQNSQLEFGANSALIITDAALTDGQDTKSLAAISFTGSGNKKVDASKGGQVLLSGKFSAADTNLKIFNGGTISSGNIEVKSVNGLLSGTISAANGTISELKLDENKLDSQMSGVAAPVKDLVSKVLGKESKKYVTGGLGADYLYDVATTSNTGVEIDAVSHAATYAGAQQAAIAAVGTLAEAVAGRIGSTGIETTVLAATGSQAHGGVWVTPMYKSVKSDGFDAQGGTYGADVDLAGVTFGADTVRGALRFGAAFNIGSGDADGKGNGQGLKDEFDYYGFGMYAGMDFSHCSLIADASVNVISHDVEGYSGHKDFGNVNAKADTTAVTMGVTGQYTLVTEVADVTPHVGMRFTRLDTDSYEMKTKKGTIGTTDFDVQNVFSIPVGVTLSKAFENHGWVFSPVADFTLTFNAGDTEAKSNVRFDGVKVNTALETEVMDKVTYGLNLGFGAQNGNFGTSVSVGYTGSSNTDSVGVNANARYMF